MNSNREIEDIEEIRRREELLEYIFEHSNIPKRYRDAKLRPLNRVHADVIEYFKSNFLDRDLDDSTDVLLFGTLGTGKTYLSCAFINRLIKAKLIFGKYVTEYQLLDLFFHKRYTQFENFREAQVLILDEVGKRELLDWQKVQLEEFLSYRYNEMLPTIYITNLLQSQFKVFMGDRLSDRFKENSIKSFAFNGKSFR